MRISLEGAEKRIFHVKFQKLFSTFLREQKHGISIVEAQTES